jgi:hypothetical protein
MRLDFRQVQNSGSCPRPSQAASAKKGSGCYATLGGPLCLSPEKPRDACHPGLADGRWLQQRL